MDNNSRIPLYLLHMPILIIIIIIIFSGSAELSIPVYIASSNHDGGPSQDVSLYHHAAVHLCAYVGACPTRHFSSLVKITLFSLLSVYVWERGGGGAVPIVEWTNGRCGSVSPCGRAPLRLCRSLPHQTFFFIGKNHTFLSFVCVCVREGGGGAVPIVEWTNGRCGSVSPCGRAPLRLCRSLPHQTFFFIGKNHTFLSFVCVCVREGEGGGGVGGWSPL